MSYSKNRDDLIKTFVPFATKEGLLMIIRGPAYNDMSPRSITAKGESSFAHESNLTLRKIVDNPLKQLADSIWNYISGKKSFSFQSDFNRWFVNTGETFVNQFNAATENIKGSNQKKIYKPICFGKAQKIMNMAFKYLFCSHDAEKNLDLSKFKYCHMALDQFTYNNGFYKDVVSKWQGRNKSSVIKPWSNLNSTEYEYIEDDILGYLNSTDNKTFVDSNSNKLSPFEAEFYIWKQFNQNSN